MLGIFLRADPMRGYPADFLRGANPRRERRPPRRSALVRNSAFILALMLATSRGTARLLIALCEQAGRAAPVLLLGALLLSAAQFAPSLWAKLDTPLEQVTLAAGSVGIDEQQVQQRLARLLEGRGFFSLNLDDVRQGLESLPLIAAVHLRRDWPGQLAVQLTMHQPIARWGADGLLVEAGRVLPSGAQQYKHLPQLIGSPGNETLLFAQYQQFEQMLRPLGLNVTRLEQRERGSGFLSAQNPLDNTVIEFVLGSSDWMQKMQHFIHFAARSKLHVSELARVDLRHQNGFAVAMKKDGQEAVP